ncbi:GH-E family nuclease [Vibrio sp. NTOU-M3]|uniref:GH-E family nuclease n=1 Tax=Vibrio sp. NTOU-M3 TaxID=3234954 RepID=UPI00349FB17A
MKNSPTYRIYIHCIASLLLAISSSSVQALTPSADKAIQLSGEFAASGGQATYSLPLSVSPGRAGHQPSLSLEYRSDSPNGPLGMGWSIGGLSNISRCGKNLAKDGRWGGVNFNADDRYCLDGQRLIAVSGRDGENLTEYRLENNGYSKIVSFGRSGNGPSYFKIWRKDGSVYEYGATADSRAELPGQAHVYKWAVNKITDTSKQNHINISYAEDSTNGTHRINEMSYVGGKVKFVYESRSDATTQYLGGSLLKRNQRLSEVSTYDSAGSKIGSYKVTYQYSAGTSRSQIKSLKYCAQSSCSTDIKFSWSGRDKVSLNSAVSTGFKAPRYFDNDGDGVSEVYGTVSTQADGKMNVKDLSGKLYNGLTSYALTGNTFSPSIARDTCTSNVASSFSDGNGSFGNYCQFSACSGEQCRYGSNGVNYGDFNGNGTESAQSGYSAVDINGDGIADKHKFDIPNGSYRYQITGSSLKTLPSASGRVLKAFSDVNNDGYLDVVMGSSTTTDNLYLYLFNGVAYTEPQKLNHQVSHEDSIYFADINNDGYPELGYNQSFYKNVNGTIGNTVLLNAGEKIFSTQDINGDGWVDILTRADTTVLQLRSIAVAGESVIDHTNAHIKHSTAYAQDKITTIEEVGVEFTINYKPAVDESVYTKPSSVGSYPVKNVTPKRYLVASFEKAPKGYGKTTYSYQYQGAKSHQKGHGFLGFNKITKTISGEVTTKVETVFVQDNQLLANGKPLQVKVFKNDTLISDTQYEYNVTTRDGYNAKYYQIYANKVTKKKYGLTKGKVEKLEEKSRALDRFGNLTHESTVISSDLEGAGKFETSSEFSYVSTGVNKNHHIYDITSVSNISNLPQLLSGYKAGLNKYCAANGDIYFKPNDHIVLIHSDVDIPLVLQRYNDYYKYQVTSHHTDLDGLTAYQGELVQTTASAFNSANPVSCGSYTYSDSDGDGNMEFSSTKLTRTELVSETGDNFWQVGAVKESSTTIKDLSGITPLSRTVVNQLNYDSNGFLQSSTTTSSDYESGSLSSSAKSITQSFEYDQWGNVTKQSSSGTDLPERTTNTRYDEQGLTVSSLTNAKGHTTNVSYNAQGLITESTSPLKARKTSFTYDEYSRQRTQTLPGKGNINNTEYWLADKCLNATPQTVSCVVTKPATGGQIITHFDYAGREVRKLHSGFSGKLVVSDTIWDRDGRKIRMTRPQFIGAVTPAPYVTFSYDALNREITKSEPANRGGRAEFTTQYDGYKTTITDARGYSHSTVTNVLGHILRKDEPLGAFQTYNYYPDGKLRTSIDSDGNTTHIRYDNLGHRNYLDDPDMGKWYYTYNAAGELIYKRDANGVETTIKYDALGRKTEQKDGTSVSTWRYDERGAIGTLSGFSGNGNQTDYYYNAQGLSEEITVRVNNEKFSTHYFYDDYERVSREVRPNGVDTTLAGTATLLRTQNSSDRLAVEYVYNPYGYVSAVRSPKTYADDAFTSASFREDIRQLLNQAIAQAQQYLTKAERYATQESFFANKAAEYERETVNVHNLDTSSQALLGNGYRYKQWCNTQGECFLRPATWVILHDDVSIPLDITLEGAIYKLTTTLANTSKPGIRDYTATLHSVSASEFNSLPLTAAHDFLLMDYDGNGQKDLMSQRDIYVAKADNDTRQELLFAADDLSEAATIAGSSYKFYTELASKLINLSEEVAKLSGLYCDFANQLGGTQIDASLRTDCANTQQASQADHLNTILTQSELEASLDNPAYIYYWQRRETDAYDHTLSETLGNGLVNTYNHDANTGRPNYITTHKGNMLFDPKLSGSTTAGRNIRFIEYRYDNHNNVTYRYDEQLGITDTWSYDALDRVVNNNVSLADKNRHGLNNPDFSGSTTFQYDKLGNITFKSGIGDYHYSGQSAGPHAVTKANGLNYQYDKAGNMLRAFADNVSEDERVLEWSPFNKPIKITRDGHTVEFTYDANHNRYLKKTSEGIETFYFGKSYERVTDTNTGDVQHKHFVYADGKLIALNTQIKGADDALKDKQIRYLHYDALNSVDMITDGYGLVVERRSYDTWGKQRKVAWREEGPLEVVQQAITNRGYTGHEEIVEVGLVHMNGRVYDQELGRFISPDPIVQAPFVTNSFNRYAYVWNNPLKYIDPTGYRLVEGAGNGDGLGQYEPPKENDNGNDDNDPEPAPNPPSGGGEGAGGSGSGDDRPSTPPEENQESIAEPETPATPKSPGMPDEEDPNAPEVPEEVPEESWSWSDFLDGVNEVLDVAGQIPGIGIGADLLNAAVYLGRGQIGNAALSAAGAVPGVGNAATGVRIANRVANRVAKGVDYSRPSGYRAGVRDKVWESAKETSTGQVRDPATGRFMSKDKAWDMGHKPGHEFRKHKKSAEERGISRKQFLDEHNNPNNYRPELPSSNRSHKGEDKTNSYFGP